MYRVMIVDDEPFILDGLCDAVDWSSFGLELSARADNGSMALQKLEDIPIDLLITDISMPIMDGLTLIRKARELRPELLVIILSGFNEFDYLKQGMQLGIENYLLKPINFTELSATLRSTVQKLNDSLLRYVVKEDDIDIIRDALLLRKMTGQIAPTDFDERAIMLGINFVGQYVTTVIVQGSGQRENRLYDDLMLTIQQQQLNVVSFHNNEGDIVLVSIADQQEGSREVALQLALHLRIQHCSCKIAIGSTSLRGNEQLSYESAQRALQLYMLLKPEDIADYERFLPMTSDGSSKLEIDWNTYSKALLSKDKEQLDERIEADFNRLRDVLGIRPEQLRSLAIEMLTRLKMELDGFIRTDVWENEPFQSSFEKVLYASNLEELLAIVKEAISTAIDELIREDKSPIIRQVLQHIEANYAEDMTLKLLGMQYNIHPVYLGKLFHKETGDSFTDYFNRYRINRAKVLLKTTNAKVHEIAREVGYWETGYFHKQFKKYVGISPIEYKELL
ncbi:MAG: response regulator [Candidatus Cohnella colombiensis]|uniref:Response regulator n=1 Tax=Candidatus Cohnella colombiensis TaxID=3121368 RepID=A0AA95JDR4_9BACL|nr:MAG: response regulator [Cohnella sp.]